MVLSLLAALGDPIAPADWVPLLGLPQPAPPPAGSAPILVELTRAAAAKRLGETVLLALVGLEQGDRLTQNPAVLARAVSALCAVGLEADARALAVEAALASGV
jgi:hypothetical protein